MFRAFARAAALCLALPIAAPAQSFFGEEDMQDIQRLDHLQRALTRLSEKALATPELRAETVELNAALRAAMTRKDPRFPAKKARLEAIQTDAARFEKAGDDQGLQKVRAEGHFLTLQLMHLRREVLKLPELAAKQAAFDRKVRAKMLELDPRAAKLEAELRRLRPKEAGLWPTPWTIVP